MVEDYRSDTFRFFSELPCERRPLTFLQPAERDSGRSEHWKRSNPSLAQSAKAVPPSSFPASANLHTASGAGLGPKRALEAI